jgi:hypothetical protein
MGVYIVLLYAYKVYVSSVYLLSRLQISIIIALAIQRL